MNRTESNRSPWEDFLHGQINPNGMIRRSYWQSIRRSGQAMIKARMVLVDIACLLTIEEENAHEHVLEHLSQARKIDFLFWFATRLRLCPSSFKCNYLAKTRQGASFRVWFSRRTLTICVYVCVCVNPIVSIGQTIWSAGVISDKKEEGEGDGDDDDNSMKSNIAHSIKAFTQVHFRSSTSQLKEKCSLRD